MAGTTTVSKAIFVAEEQGVGKTIDALSKLAGQAGQTGAATSSFSKQASNALQQFAKAREEALKGSSSIAPETDKAFVRVQEQNARAVRIVAKEIDGLTSRLDPAHRSMVMFAQDQERINALAAAGAISVEKQGQLLALSATKYRQVGTEAKEANDNVKLTGQQMQGLGYQINDVATMLALGASPFQIIASQAGQVIQVLQEGGGLKSSLSAIGSSIASLATRTNLIVGGLTAAGAAAIYFATRSDSSVKTAEEALKGYKTLVDSLQDSYSRAGDAAERFLARSRKEGPNIAMASIQGTGAELQASLAQELDRLIPKTQNIANRSIRSFAQLTPEVLKSQDAIRSLGRQLENGQITAARFREQVALIRINPKTPPEIVKIADDLLASSVNARDLANALGAVGEAAASASGKMGRLMVPSSQDMTAPFGGAINMMKRLRPEAFDELTKGLKDQAEAFTESRKTADEYGTAIASLRSSLTGSVDALQLQISTFGQSDGAIAAARLRMDSMRQATEAAREAGKALVDPATVAFIEDQAKAYGALTDRLKTMTDAQSAHTKALEETRQQQEKLRNLAADASGFRAGLFMSDTDAAIAGQLRSSGVDAESAFGKQYAEYERASSRLEEYRDLNREVWQGIGQDIMNGTKPIEAVGNSLKNLAGRMLDKSIQNTADSLFGSVFGGQKGGFSIPGLGGELGTAANPMHVTFVGGVGGAAASLLGGDASEGGGAMGAINKLLGGGGKAGSGGKSAYRDAIAAIESRGSGGYAALGPITSSGDRAYGRYQVMGNNIPSWSKEALGRSITPAQFMADPKLQDQIFDKKFGGYVSKFGERGAAQAWFGGPGSVGKEGRKDMLGTSIGGYGDKFEKELAKLPQSGERAVSSASAFADTTSNLTSGLGSTFASLDQEMLRIAGDFTPAFGGALQSVLDAFASSLGNKGGFSGGWLAALAGGITGGATGAPGGADAWAGLRLATGGRVSGPGTGTSDSIPAALSDGEFIVNAAATSKNLGLLHAINSGKAVRRLAAGGYMPPAMPAAVVPSGRAVAGGVIINDNRSPDDPAPQVKQRPDGTFEITLDRKIAEAVAKPGKPAHRALQASGLRSPLIPR